MITNLLATVLVAVVTNWTDVYEPVYEPWYVSCPSVVTTYCNLNYVWPPQIQLAQQKYIGKDGIVSDVTEIRFDWLGQEQVHRIEKPLRKIVMRCHEKPPVEPEKIWDEPVIIELPEDNDITNWNGWTVTNLLFVVTNVVTWSTIDLEAIMINV